MRLPCSLPSVFSVDTTGLTISMAHAHVFMCRNGTTLGGVCTAFALPAHLQRAWCLAHSFKPLGRRLFIHSVDGHLSYLCFLPFNSLCPRGTVLGTPCWEWAPWLANVPAAAPRPGHGLSVAPRWSRWWAATSPTSCACPG